MWQKLRLYCACQWGEGERTGQGNTCPGHSRALSARGFSLIREGSSTRDRGRETALGSNQGKTEVSESHAGGHANPMLWGLGGFGRSWKDLFGILKAPLGNPSQAHD